MKRTITLTPADIFTGAPVAPAARRVSAPPLRSDPAPSVIDDAPFPGVSQPIAVLLGWVGSDDERAKVALVAEAARPEGARRVSLLADLEGVIAAAAPIGYDAGDRGNEPPAGVSSDELIEDEL